MVLKGLGFCLLYVQYVCVCMQYEASSGKRGKKLEGLEKPIAVGYRVTAETMRNFT